MQDNIIQRYFSEFAQATYHWETVLHSTGKPAGQPHWKGSYQD